MGRRKDLTNEEKAVIKELRHFEVSICTIAKRLKRAKSTVSAYLTQTNDSTKRKNSGRKSVLNSRDKRLVLKKATTNELSTREISRSFPSAVSHSTVWRTLNSSSIVKYSKILKKPKLSEAQIKKRRIFSQTHQTWYKEWKNVIFSDEKKFNLDGPDGLHYYWHDLRKDSKIISRRFGGGRSIMVWVAFCNNEKLPIVVLQGKINSQKYQENLEKHLKPFIERKNAKELIFQHDNAPSHASKSTNNWLKQHNIQTLDWPSNSPDLNPVENVWGLISREIYKNGTQYNNTSELEKAVTAAWANLKTDFLSNLTATMKDRVFQLIASQGKFTKF